MKLSRAFYVTPCLLFVFLFGNFFSSPVHAWQDKPTFDPPVSISDPQPNSLKVEEDIEERTLFSKKWVSKLSSLESKNPVQSSYTEINSGLHFNAGTLANPMFKDADNTIFATKDGAEVTSLAHKVRFGKQLSTSTATIEHSIDGSSPVLSAPSLLVYRDIETDQSVILARSQSSELTFHDNNALYKDAFDALHADVRYTVRKGNLEQDVLLHSKLPPPSVYGLNNESTVLTVLTRLFNLEDHVGDGRKIEDFSNQNSLVESERGLKELNTRSIKGPIVFKNNGHPAYQFARSYFLPQDGSSVDRTPVSKRLVTLQGIHFLAEEIPASKVMAPELAEHLIDPSITKYVQAFESLDVLARNVPEKTADRLASVQLPELDSPMVIDYIAVAGGTITTDFIFESGQTYLISGPTVMTGVVTIEGNTVIKFDDVSTGASLDISNPVIKTSSSTWAIFTSKHDDTVGEIITGSTGSPTVSQYTNALTLGPSTVQYVQIRYADTGISFHGNGAFSLKDSEFFAVGTPMSLLADTSPATLDLNNLLVAFGNNGPSVTDDGTNAVSITANNLTLYSLSDFAFDTTLTSTGSTFSITDSLFLDIQGASVFSGTSPNTEDFNAFHLTSQNGTGTNDLVLTSDPVLTDFFIDQTSPLIDAGSKLAGLAGLYHYTTDTNEALEATSTVDIGYHLPPSILSFSILATNSFQMDKDAAVPSGNIGVNDQTPGPYLTSEGQLTIDSEITIPQDYSLFADSVFIKEGTVISGDLHYNTLTQLGTVNGNTFTPLSLPIFDALPIFRSADLGTVSDVVVNSEQTLILPAGDYDNITVGESGKLHFTGGVYNIRSIFAEQEAELLFDQPSELRVEKDINTDERVFIGPASGSELNASDIQIFVEGIGALGTHMTVDNLNLVLAHVYAPNGLIHQKEESQFFGIYLGKDIRLGEEAQSTLQVAVTPNTGSAPFIMPPGGTVIDSVNVKLLTITSGASIFYTLDGTTPDATSTPFTGPFILTQDTTVKAIAIRAGFTDSAVTTAIFTVLPMPQVAAVAFNPIPGTFQDSVDITLSTTTPGASIFYTLNGTTPTTASSIFTTPINLTASTTVTAFATNTGFLDSAVTSATYVVEIGGGLPPDPSTIAPPLDNTLISNVATNTEFLYTGANPIQTGMAPGTIEPKRGAVVRGKVLTRDGLPLPGVTVSILNHPEFGQTESRSDGFFDMAVNGGGQLTVDYQLVGYLPAQRNVKVPWQDFAIPDDVALVALDPQITTIDLTSAIPIQVAQGSVQTDSDGTRQVTLLFPQGTTAEMIVNGVPQPISTLSVRATEYSVGSKGPMAMPAELPGASAYTFAAEFSVDEAIAQGATSVTFSQPVYGYLENFLNFPTGINVPSGSYDRVKGQWIPEASGKVIKILSISSGLADLDTDGDDVADGSTVLAALNITDDERTTLATQYTTGQSLWRVPMNHFSTYDWNWARHLAENF